VNAGCFSLVAWSRTKDDGIWVVAWDEGRLLFLFPFSFISSGMDEDG
jgi:hypothetical protein